MKDRATAAHSAALMDRLRGPWLISALLAVAVVLWVGSGVLGGDAAPPEAEGDPRTPQLAQVRVLDQSARPVERIIEVYGRTEPARTVTLRAETSGRVTRIGVARGARAEEGALLVSLAPRDRAARLRTAEARVEQRRIEFEAQDRLKTQDYISASNLAAARAELEQARAELEQARLDMSYMEIRAPFDGAVLERMVEVGDFVQAGDPVLSYVDDRRLIVTGTVAEQDIGALRLGATGSAELVTGERIEGRVRYIAPVADTATRTFPVELELDNRDGELRAGVTAEMRLRAGTRMAHRISPALMTLSDAGELGIKTVDAQDRVRFHPVRVVAADEDGVWVEGLPDQVRVVTAGQGWVKDGEAVRAVAEPGTDRLAGS